MSELPRLVDDVLTTTRSVRRRLDLTRPVDPALVDECLRIALQAPTGGNRQRWSFIVVTDRERRAALGDIYRRGWADYRRRPDSAPMRRERDARRSAEQRRVVSSAAYLAEHIHEVPVLVVPCIEGRTDDAPVAAQASQFGSILPAVWSFMLAGRARGLACAWTTIHLFHERDAAELLGIPYDTVMQTALVPVAHSIGTDFRPAPGRSLEGVVHRETWAG